MDGMKNKDILLKKYKDEYRRKLEIYQAKLDDADYTMDEETSDRLLSELATLRQKIDIMSGVSVTTGTQSKLLLG